MAGMLLGSSVFATQVRADISSLRVVLLTLFFGAAGNLNASRHNWGQPTPNRSKLPRDCALWKSASNKDFSFATAWGGQIEWAIS